MQDANRQDTMRRLRVVGGYDVQNRFADDEQPVALVIPNGTHATQQRA